VCSRRGKQKGTEAKMRGYLRRGERTKGKRRKEWEGIGAV